MIEVRDLSKFYGGKRALGPVSFEIAKDESVGFLGLNGAGKTTALRILACDLRPSAGAVKVDGINAVENPHEVRKLVGFLPETPPLYGDMTVVDMLRFAGRLRGMGSADLERRIPEVEEVTHLREVEGELVRNLSHGFKQRVGVAQAIVHKPRLLVLDEPTRGLDPVQVVEMRQMIRDLKTNHTILISSHILPEISETCDRLLVLGEGSIVGSGTEEKLSSELLVTRRVVVAVKPTGAADAVERCLRGVASVSEVKKTGEDDGALVFEVEASDDVRAEICKALVGAGHGVLKLDRAQRKLESIFLQLVKGGAGARH